MAKKDQKTVDELWELLTIIYGISNTRADPKLDEVAQRMISLIRYFDTKYLIEVLKEERKRQLSPSKLAKSFNYRYNRTLSQFCVEI
jgi:aldehyde:ferredoxin oxidoreductase